MCFRILPFQAAAKEAKQRLCFWTKETALEMQLARKQWNNIIKVLQNKNCPLRILYPMKILFKNEGAISRFLDAQRQELSLVDLH